MRTKKKTPFCLVNTLSIELIGSFSPFSDMMEIEPLAEIMIEAYCSVVQWYS